MRYRGEEFRGRGITVAIIDSGVDVSNPRLAGTEIDGYSITLGASQHALLSADFADQNGHGTEIAIAVRRHAPEVRILAVKIMGERLRTSAELMAAGIETAARNGAQVINLSLGTPNMGRALLLRDVCAKAVDYGSVVLAAAHPKGERAYPADLPEAVGVSAHMDTPIDKFFYFDPKRFSRKDWGVLSGKFLTHGYSARPDGTQNRYRGPGIATAYLAGMVACLREARPEANSQETIENLRRLALVPVPGIGYS